MGAQNFDFAPKFPPNERFTDPNFAFLNENFPTIKIFSGGLEFSGVWSGEG